jgi:hypothetical protein
MKSRSLSLLFGLVVFGFSVQDGVAQTAFGEIEGRAAPVSHRRCIGGGNAGALCNEDADCPGSTCQDRNIFNISVNVRFGATAGELQDVRDAFSAANELLWDVTDCQAQFGQVTLLNNPSGTRGTYWVTDPGYSYCAAATGTWGQYSGGNINVTLTSLTGASADGCVTHEFSHLVFDVRDEYESRAPGCGALAGDARCPLVASGEEECLMECCVGDVGTEFCWGQGNPMDVTDISGGNHDPSNVTEQSRCRSNRSCWDQVGWSWPNTFLVPAGAPDPSCPTPPDDIVFLDPPSTARVVLVLDRSGSMILETPDRIERLRVAALDFVDLAENGMELGLVSFGSGPDGVATDEVPIAALGADRSDYIDAINALTPSGATNIGDGLQHARDMIIAAGGVTADTYIVLMTDGLNNRPLGMAAADLQSKIDTLLADGIPVYVTCTGDDLGLDSQCAEIATGTNGFYVDSSDSSELPESFADIHELIRGRSAARSVMSDTSKALTYNVEIEADADVATFVGLCRDTDCLAMSVIDPTGMTASCQRIPQGRFCRFHDPLPGDWTVVIDPIGQTQETYLSRAYVGNPVLHVPAVARFPVVEPGKPQLLCAHPTFMGPLIGVAIAGFVEKPDGSTVAIQLNDQGTGGDQASEDGTYCADFSDTMMPGAYSVRLLSNAMQAKLAECDPPDCPSVGAPAFVRETRFSFTVNDLPPGPILCTELVAGQLEGRIQVPITLSDGSGVAGFQTDLHFDTSVLKPVSVLLGADTAAAGGWTVAGNLVGAGRFRVLGHSNPPTGLAPGMREVALVEFDILPAAPSGPSTVTPSACVLSDKDGLRLPCNLCRSPGGVIVSEAAEFRFRPIVGPVGVDRFHPLPFPVAVEALDAMGGVAAGYNGTAAMSIPGPTCASTLFPSSLPFSSGVGGPQNFEVACCLDPLLPLTSTPLSIDATDASLGISGMSDAFLGVAKGDVDASGGTDVVDVTRAEILALALSVPTPPPTAFQRWAADMLDSQCAVDNTHNVLDVIRIRNKALGMPSLCPCGRTGQSPSAALAAAPTERRLAPSSPIRLRIVREGRAYVVRVEGAQDLGGIQLELRGIRGRVDIQAAGLAQSQGWQVSTNSEATRGVRVIAYSNTPSGVDGAGALLRIQGGMRPSISSATASDSLGREIPVTLVQR